MPSVSKYNSFSELALHEAQDRDFCVRQIDRCASTAIIIAPHGGMIEVGTSEIAALIAGADFSLFGFEGLKSYGENGDLHITSHLFDHPDCLLLVARHSIVLSVHGCKGEGSQIFLGGLDTQLIGELEAELARAGFEVIADGVKYPGRHPDNICNRGLRSRGAQVEITYDLRQSPHCESIAGAVRTALESFSRSLQR